MDPQIDTPQATTTRKSTNGAPSAPAASTPEAGWKAVVDEVAQVVDAHPKLSFAAFAAAAIVAVATFGVSEVLVGLGVGYLGHRWIRRGRPKAKSDSHEARA